MQNHYTDENQALVDECVTAFADQFMKPRFYVGSEIQGWIMEEGLDADDDGIYCRLSAAGYMDCTDLSGPYATVKEAVDYIMATYGDNC